MIYIRNIILVTLRFITNRICIFFHLKFRFEFDFIRILEKNYCVDSEFYFVQVGANDGIIDDNIYHFVKSRKGKGLVIEPIKELYEKLRNNYSYNPNVKPINKAVHAFENSITLYKIHPEKLKEFPEWAQGIGSINENHHKKSNIPSSAIISEVVPSSHLMTIIKEEYQYSTIDLIIIDIEGYDYEALKMIDFSTLKPKLIVLEYINLRASDINNAKTLLQQQNYYCFFWGADLIGIKLPYLKL